MFLLFQGWSIAAASVFSRLVGCGQHKTVYMPWPFSNKDLWMWGLPFDGLLISSADLATFNVSIHHLHASLIALALSFDTQTMPLRSTHDDPTASQ